MSSTQWPRVLDMTEDDSRKALRTLELSAYSSVVAAFRAQGNLSEDKRSLLEQLQISLGVGNDRHRAEVRRCVNDEKLSTIALHMVGHNHEGEWLVEGRRMAPISERLSLHTAYTNIANQSAHSQANKNALLLNPNLTGNKERFTTPGTLFNPPPVVYTSTTANSSTTTLLSPSYSTTYTHVSSANTTPAPVTKLSRSLSPNTNIVVLPSGTSIHIKGGLNLDEDEDITGAKRRRIASTDSVVNSSKQIVGRGQVAPVKLSLNKPNPTSIASQQKVILVQSSASQQSMSSPIAPVTTTITSLNKSVVPIVKSITPVTSHTSVVYPLTSNASSTQHTIDSALSPGPSIHTHQALTIQKPRTKATLTSALSSPRITGHKQPITVSRHGVVIPVGASTSNVTAARTGVHVKQEGAMKIITSSTNKLLPKPTSTINSPIVVVTSAAAAITHTTTQAASTPHRNTVITRPGGTGAVAINNNKVISIHTGGKVISAGTSVAGALKSQKPSVISTTAYRGQHGSMSNPSAINPSQTITTSTGKSGNVVIVQQPGQLMRGNSKSTKQQIISASSSQSIDKEFISFIQKQSSGSDNSSIIKGGNKNSPLPTAIKTITANPVGISLKSTDYFKIRNEAKVTSPYIDQLQQSISNQSHSHIIVTSLPSSSSSSNSNNNSSVGITNRSVSSTTTSTPKVTSTVTTTSTWLQSPNYPIYTGVGNELTSQPTFAVTGSQSTLVSSEQVSMLPVSTVSSSSTTTTVTPPKMDIFSSALAEAEIFLDPYEFIDEDEPMVATTVTSPTDSGDVMSLWSNAAVDTAVAVTPAVGEPAASGETNPAVYHLSQGAAILSGDLPFITRTPVTTASYDITEEMDTVPSSGLSSSNQIAPAGSSGPIILPKGKEAIRILTALPNTTVATSLAGLAVSNRSHVTAQSYRQGNSSPRPVDIQPKQTQAIPIVSTIATNNLNYSSPTIDAKILILPPGVGQPTTPVSAPEVTFPTTNIDGERINMIIRSSQPSIVSAASKGVSEHLMKYTPAAGSSRIPPVIVSSSVPTYYKQTVKQSLATSANSLATNKQDVATSNIQLLSSAATALLELNQEPASVRQPQLPANKTVVMTMQDILPASHSHIPPSSKPATDKLTGVLLQVDDPQSASLNTDSQPIIDSIVDSSTVPIVDTSKLTVVSTTDTDSFSSILHTRTDIPANHAEGDINTASHTIATVTESTSSDPVSESVNYATEDLIESTDTAVSSAIASGDSAVNVGTTIPQVEPMDQANDDSADDDSFQQLLSDLNPSAADPVEEDEGKQESQPATEPTDKVDTDTDTLSVQDDNDDEKSILDKLTIVGPEGNLTTLEYESGLYIEKPVVAENSFTNGGNTEPGNNVDAEAEEKTGVTNSSAASNEVPSMELPVKELTSNKPTESELATGDHCVSDGLNNAVEDNVLTEEAASGTHSLNKTVSDSNFVSASLDKTEGKPCSNAQTPENVTPPSQEHTILPDCITSHSNTIPQENEKSQKNLSSPNSVKLQQDTTSQEEITSPDTSESKTQNQVTAPPEIQTKEIMPSKIRADVVSTPVTNNGLVLSSLEVTQSADEQAVSAPSLEHNDETAELSAVVKTEGSNSVKMETGSVADISDESTPDNTKEHVSTCQVASGDKQSSQSSYRSNTVGDCGVSALPNTDPPAIHSVKKAEDESNIESKDAPPSNHQAPGETESESATSANPLPVPTPTTGEGSQEALSVESSPPLRPKHFEKVYRPRKSIGLSHAEAAKSELTFNDKPNNDSQNTQPERPEVALDNVNLNSATDAGKLATETRTPLLILHRSPSKLDSTSTMMNGNSLDPEENADWLADSTHSLSNGPDASTASLSQGEDDSDEEDSSSNIQPGVTNSSGVVQPSTLRRKRRRKSDHSLSWSKGARGLLKRVMMYRGTNRPKSEHGAAAWFLKPVSDDEAPGYSNVISQPMDLGTVKRRLEANHYTSLEEFKSDMMLIYTNCCTYNPPEHNVRRDCELVFLFFRQEYEKLVNRLSAQAAGESKRLKVENNLETEAATATATATAT